LLSAADARADRAEEVLGAGGTTSVQFLHEFASVGSRRRGTSTAEVREILLAIRAGCKIAPIGIDTHDSELQLAERCGMSIHDASIRAGCKALLVEDVQVGQTIDGCLEIRNPFR
jgi:predicted nucleic acid-binding protein